MATETDMRAHRCCFTGHRPHRLTRPETEIRLELEREIRCAIADGYSVFISGMAQGVDIWAAQIVLKLRREGNDIRLICACPFNGFEQRWSSSAKKEYMEILSSADLVRFICSRYNPACFQIRNEWMVNHSSRVIAVFNGQPSGTKNTIDYAVRNAVNVTYIDG